MKIDRPDSTKVSENPSKQISEIEESPVDFLHTGSCLLNLAASGKGRNGGWARGRIINLVGDGSSGKTMMALELCAYALHHGKEIESAVFPAVKKVKIVYDNAEGVMDFPIEKMYGKEFKKSITWENSCTVQEWGRKFGREIDSHKQGEMLIYVIDSLDSLTSQEGLDRFDKAVKNDKEEDGTYGVEKAKFLSQSFFANICSKTQGKDITLVIISQIRQKIGVTFGEKYGRTGGKALDFYTHQVCWLAEIEKLKKTFRGEERVYGIRILAKMKRNKVAKPFREAELIVLFDYGVDDISSSLAYLYGPKVKLLSWDGQDYNRADLIAFIENNQLQDELARRVEEAWNEVEEAIKTDRRKRYE